MRSFRVSLLAGAGAVALTGGLIAPGIAGAAEGDSTETVTQEGRYSYTATDNGDCTVTFDLVDETPEGKKAYWRADYQVDDEAPFMNVDSDRPVFRPAVVSHQDTYDAITGREVPYDIGLGTATIDLSEPRTVPIGDGTEVGEAPAVAANGSHTVTFGVYQGPGGTSGPEYEKFETITVTGCEGDGSGSVGSLDIFGSLGDLGAGSLEGLLPEFE